MLQLPHAGAPPRALAQQTQLPSSGRGLPQAGRSWHGLGQRETLALAAAGLSGLVGRCRSGRVATKAMTQSRDLQELDRLLARLIEAEVNEESTRSRVQVQDQVMNMLLSPPVKRELRSFGTAKKTVEKKLYTLEEMKEKGVDATMLLNPKDNTLDSIRTAVAAAAAIGGAALILLLKPATNIVVFLALTSILLLFFDQVINRGFGELLVVDSLGRWINKEYPSRVARHEAGHFLVAYLLGIMPKAYTLSAWEAFSKYNSMSTQAGTVFLDDAIQREVSSGKISGKTLDDFVCVALGGIAAEYISFGQANGGMSDLLQLEALFGALSFDQQQTNLLLRTNVMNTVSILQSQRAAHDALVEAMTRGDSVGRCIEIIEQSIS